MTNSSLNFKLLHWRHWPRVLVVLAILTPLLLNSCWKNRFDFDNISTPDSWNPDVCAPLIHSNLTMKDILNDWDDNNLFVEDETGFLYLVYWNQVYSRSAAEMLAIPNQNVNTSFAFSVGGALNVGTSVTAPPFTRTYSFTMPNFEVLERAILNPSNGGNLEFQVTSPNMNHNATINISIPQATLNGVPFSQNIDYLAGFPLNETIDLSGYDILFNNVFPNVNALDITYTVTVHGLGGANNSPYTFNMSESFEILSFHALYGDFKQASFTLPNDTVTLRIFENNVYGMVDFENPYVRMYAYNSLGIPMNIGLNNFRSISYVNPPYQVVLTGHPNPWYINAPNLSQIGQTVTTSFVLDKTNSNVKDAINISPERMIVDINGLINPAGGISNNFVIDTTRLKVDMQVELPLHGRAWDFRLADTMDFEFGEDADMDMIEFLEFRINTDNGFPVDGIMQLYFLDPNGVILDSVLIDPTLQVINAAPVGPAPDYRVTGSRQARVVARIEQPRLVNLEPTSQCVVWAKLWTVSNGTEIVKIYSDYFLDVRVGVHAKFNVDF
jgi:hypothetical protein